MKPISEIVGMQEYKNHVLQAAMLEFANTPNEGPSIYYDSFGNNPIIYHLTTSRHIKTTKDEVRIKHIPEFIEQLEFVDDKTRTDLMDIHDKFMNVVAKVGFEFDLQIKPPVAYGATGWDEIWANNEFVERFRADQAEVKTMLEPIQRIVSDL